ncbi:MAG: ATP-binding protein [Chloroflexota bacterium]
MTNRYTDTPELPPNLLLGSVRLLLWLFFHPSAWRGQVARLDVGVSPLFCLAELNGRSLRSLPFWRHLIMLTFTWPLALGGVLAGGLWLAGVSGATSLLAGMVGTAVSLLTTLIVGLVGSVPVGIAAGMAVGLVVGAASTLFLSSSGNPLPALLLEGVVGLASGLAGGLGFGVAAGISQPRTLLSEAVPLGRQSSGVVIGLLVGVGTGLLAGSINGRLAAALLIALPLATALWGRTGRWQHGLVAGLLGGVVGFVGGGDVGGGAWGLLFVVGLITALYALPYFLADRLVGAWAGALAGALGSGAGLYLFLAETTAVGPLLLFALLGVLLGLAGAWWRPVLTYPLLVAANGVLLRLDERRVGTGKRPFFPHHSAFWDEFQRLPLAGLADHLLLVLTHWPEEGARALAYLADSRQRWAAQTAQIELEVRQLAGCGSLTAVATIGDRMGLGELTDPASALLRSLQRVSQDVAAALAQESAYNQRLALRGVEERLDGLLRELTRSSDPYAPRFRPVVARWRELVAAGGLQLAAEAELRQELDNPYIIGVPLTEKQELFVGRTDISSRIEQLLLDRRRPPLLLYGQRRVGKTSLLNNLGRLLPRHIVPLFVDLQGPATRAGDAAGFFYNVARAMRQSARRQRQLDLPDLTRETVAADPFTAFDEWLDGVEGALGSQTGLLLLDEFEVLAEAFANRRLDEAAILGTLRHLIQHRPRFKVLLSGSHTLAAFHRWSSYLINVQLVHIGLLSEAETAQLVERPVAGFALRYEPAARARVWELTSGHPFLVQLLCAEVVALKNEQPPDQRRLATVGDVETAVLPALEHGSFFFADLAQNQVDEAGRLFLRGLARGEETAVSNPPLLEQLIAQEILHPNHTFRVELVRRWFAL